MPNRRARRKAPRAAVEPPFSRGYRMVFAVFLVLCLVAVGWRVLRPVLWPSLHHETPHQTSSRMFDDNSFLR
jgi:hypothetical protein